MSASWGNASSGRVLELVDVDGDRLELHELPLGAGRDGHYEAGSVHVQTTAAHGEVILTPAQAVELREWLYLGRGVTPFEIVFPGADAAQRRACKLALFALAQPVAERDPLAGDVTGRLVRELEVTRAGARRVLELLRRGGWIDAAGELSAMVRT